MVIVRESLYKLFIDEACLIDIYTHIIKETGSLLWLPVSF